MLDRILAGHRQLEAIGARLLALLDDEKPDAAALKAARWELATKFMQHLAFKDRHIYANLAASDDPAAAALGRRCQAEYADHLAGYAAYAQEWPEARMLAEWPRYRIVCREQLREMDARIERAERELYPYADAIVRIDEAHPPSRSWTRDAFAIKASVAPAG